MKKLVLLLSVFITLTYTLKAQWQTAPYGISYTGGKVSINTVWASEGADVNLTINGAQLIHGVGASLFFGGLTSTDEGYGEYGIEYNVSAGGLNFWKPWGSNGAKNWVLFLKDDGRVGIGTQNLTADYLLTVAGGIHARKIYVTSLAGADFVFAKGYKLRTLQELDQFVSVNQHLPEIPSAKEMEEKGMDMGEFQIKLLQKVEELTLYIIQQQKEIEELKTRLSN